MPCILKALIAWIILLVVSGAIGLFLRQALFGLLVPFPAPSTNLAVEQALRSTAQEFQARPRCQHGFLLFGDSCLFVGGFPLLEHPFSRSGFPDHDCRG